ncbi:MAG: endopeptidase La [Deltaproteobacteria bacterium RIFOXYA12_FULL_61_11]|nr:MAG: endopeptidase La [Deltaproteobacteria bacterium RIFOXYA12_FULL_61_11]
MPRSLPLLPIRNTVLFPMMALPLTIKRKETIKLIDDVSEAQGLFAITMAKQEGTRLHNEEDLHRIGTVVKIFKMLRLPDNHLQVIVHGLSRMRIEAITSRDPYLLADISPLPEPALAAGKDLEIEARVHALRSNFGKYVELVKNVPQEFVLMVMNVRDPRRLADIMSTAFDAEAWERQQILETLDPRLRLDVVNDLLAKQLQVARIGKEIQDKVKGNMDEAQRKYFLREKLKSIQKELGEGEDGSAEVEELRLKMDKAGLPEEARKAAERELDRLARMSTNSAEYTVSKTYLDWLLELPWSVASTDDLSLRRVKKVLDEDHFGLEKVKERILEFLAVRKLKPDLKSPILCFVGPPGVGKTSLGQSIARAMDRKFIRMSLGGVRDEAEIRGHRRTYIGSLPGRILQSIRRAGTNNPVLMLDEVDKLGADFRGDPSSALLEVLDPEQNHHFQDHYLDVGFDLSRVLFIVTANVLHTIPEPLRDRMEVLDLPGYAENEKLEIARRYLLPKQIAGHGLPERQIRFQRKALSALILDYTMEAGVRNMERELARICRKVARDYTVGRQRPVTVTPTSLVRFLGKPKRRFDMAERLRIPGVAIGLAWNAAGGDILFIEANRMPGKKGLTLTGKLGEVMRESAQAALTYVRANAQALEVDDDFFERFDLHIHIPSGAIPKDGPSAGVTLFTALVSLLSDRLVRSDLAMTGEISLRGQVLPVGGIKEKVMAAHRAGIKSVILPERNREDLEDVPDEVAAALTFHFVSTLAEVESLAFEARTPVGSETGDLGSPP